MVTEISPEIYNCGAYPYKSPGAYGYLKNGLVVWEQCRDRVQLINKSFLKDGLWFSHRKNKGQNVVSFIQKIEEILKVKPKSNFGITNFLENILWVRMSSFWTKNLIRRSFFTMALRCGQIYSAKKNNLNKCFENNKYGKETMVAIDLFLNGYTNYNGGPLHMFEGWFRILKNKTATQVKEILTK